MESLLKSVSCYASILFCFKKPRLFYIHLSTLFFSTYFLLMYVLAPQLEAKINSDKGPILHYCESHITSSTIVYSSVEIY